MVALLLRCRHQIGEAIDHHRGLGNDAEDNAHDVHSCAYKTIGEEIVYHIYAERNVHKHTCHQTGIVLAAEDKEHHDVG